MKVILKPVVLATAIAAALLPIMAGAQDSKVVARLNQIVTSYTPNNAFMGAVLVVEGDTETATLRIGNKIELEQDYQTGYAITIVLILISLAAILAGAWIRRRRTV